MEKLDRTDNEVTIELLDDDEHKLEDEVDEMYELTNSTEVMEAEHTDIEVEVDGDEVIVVYEMAQQMMISEQVEVVDMLSAQQQIVH